jgi:hypothetical protein
VRLGASRGMPVSIVPRTVRFDPNPRIFGTAWMVVLTGQPTVCLGLPCKI